MTDMSNNIKFSSSAEFSHTHPYDRQFAERVPLLQAFNLALSNYLSRSIREAAADHSAREFTAAECGVYTGSSLIACGRIAADANVPFRLFGLDTFAGLPPLSEIDQSLAPPDALYRTTALFTDTSIDEVQRKVSEANLSDHIKLLPGLFSETLDLLTSNSYDFVNIDCDLYEPHLECLTYFYGRTVPGGIIFFDDYYSIHYPMARAAIDAFMADKPEQLLHLRFGPDAPNRTKAFFVKY